MQPPIPETGWVIDFIELTMTKVTHIRERHRDGAIHLASKERDFIGANTLAPTAERAAAYLLPKLQERRTAHVEALSELDRRIAEMEAILAESALPQGEAPDDAPALGGTRIQAPEVGEAR